jgi:hypothetical protein
VRPRWQEWVIGVGIVALFVTGVLAIWGDEIRNLWRGEEDRRPQPQETQPVVVPPGGNAQGPF